MMGDKQRRELLVWKRPTSLKDLLHSAGIKPYCLAFFGVFVARCRCTPGAGDRKAHLRPAEAGTHEDTTNSCEASYI